MARWARRIPPRAPLPGGRRPPLRSGAPRHATVAPVRRNSGARQGGPLIGLDPDVPHVFNSPSTADPTAMRAPRAGHPGSRRGAMGADRARGGSQGRKGLQKPARTARWTAPAHRVSDLRGQSPLRGRTDRGRQVVADSRTVMPGRIKPMDHRIQAARTGAVPLRYPPRRRASPPSTMGATGPGGPHLRGRRSLAALPLPRAGTRQRNRPGPSHNPR